MNKKVLKTLAGAVLFTFYAPFVLAITCIEGQLPAELKSLLEKIRDVLIAIGLIIAAIYIVLGGYTFITSGGSPEKAEAGRKQIMFAVIGIVIILIAVSLIGIVKAIIC